MGLPPEEPEDDAKAAEGGGPEAGQEAEEAPPGVAEAEPAAEEPLARAEAEAENDELEDLRGLLMRVKADFSNYQKRVEREFNAARRSGEADVLLRLLALLEVVERTEREADKYHDFASLREALSIVAKEAERFARDSGLERIPAVGRPFDPAVHEALAVVETEEEPEGHVVEEVRPGYVFDGKVLRHAQVTVARRPKERE